MLRWISRAGRATEKLRKAIEARPLRPFEYLEVTPKPDRDAAIAEAEAVLRKGAPHPGRAPMRYAPPIDWDHGERSFNFHLHAMQPLNVVLAAWDLSGRQAFLDAASGIVFDWMGVNLGAKIGLDDAAVEACLADPHPSRWYDMAIGQRLYKFAYLLDVLARRPEAERRDLTRLADAIALHHRILAVPRIYRAGNNHGFFQAITQLAAATRLPELAEAGTERLARERLAEMIDRQYLADDVHAEHSPGYHFMVTTALINARNAGMTDEALSARIDRFEARQSLFVKPDGKIAPIGDTDPRAYRRSGRYADFYRDEAMRYIVSGGHDGAPPEPGVHALPDSGYAVARLDPAEGKPGSFRRQSYLLQAASFHSRTHKQADHLGFVWHERGYDILGDPGRFAYANAGLRTPERIAAGFYYSDPRRIYAEETRAHNCVEIDGRSYERVAAEPFGSALRGVSAQGDLAVFESALTHSGGVAHRRTLVLRPGHFLLVLDLLAEPGIAHDYRQWFCVPPPWRVTRQGRRLVGRQARNPGRPGFEAISLDRGLAWDDPVSGRREPEMLGWISDRGNRMTRATSLCLPAPGVEQARFATIFLLNGPSSIAWRRTAFDAATGEGRAQWRDARGSHALMLARDETDGFSATFRTRKSVREVSQK